jgi:hypothetical protein
VSREWLGGAIIVAVLAWTLAQLTAFSRARIPLYELVAEGRSAPLDKGPSEGVRPAAEGGAR